MKWYWILLIVVVAFIAIYFLFIAKSVVKTTTTATTVAANKTSSPYVDPILDYIKKTTGSVFQLPTNTNENGTAVDSNGIKFNGSCPGLVDEQGNCI